MSLGQVDVTEQMMIFGFLRLGIFISRLESKSNSKYPYDLQLGQLLLTALLLVALVTAWLGVVCVTIPVNFVVRKRLRHPRISNQDSPLERQQLSPQQFFILRLGLVQLLGIITSSRYQNVLSHQS